MSQKYINALWQEITKIGKSHLPDLNLACELALKLPSGQFEAVHKVFIPWLKLLSTLSYEQQILLAKVWHKHGTANDFFDVNTLDLIPAVQVQWLQTFLAIAPEKAVMGNHTHLLNKALVNVQPRSNENLEKLIRWLLADKQHHTTTLFALLHLGIRQALLSYQLFVETVLYLLKSTEYQQVAKACNLIKEYRFCFAQCPETELRILMNRGADFEVLALKTLSLWGTHPLFEEIFAKEDQPLPVKIVCLEVLVQQAAPELANKVTALLLAHPIHGTPLINCLLTMTYDGVFCDKKMLKPLVDFYFAYDVLSAANLATLLQGRFDKKIAGYATNNEVEPRKWIKFLKVSGSVEAKEQLHQILKYEDCSSYFSLLSETLISLDYRPSEEILLKHLPAYPNECLHALKYLGGKKTIQYLKTALGIGESQKTSIPSFETHALELLLSLVDDPAEILTYLKDNNLPHKFDFTARLHAFPDASIQHFLSQTLSQGNETDILQALFQLNNLGSFETLKQVIAKLADVNEDIREAAWNCAQQITRRAYVQKRIWAKNLLLHNQATAVNTTLAQAILPRLAQARSSLERQHYLNCLAQCIDPHFDISQLAGVASSQDPHVLKFYIQCLGESQNPKAFYLIARFLSPTQDIFTLRQALIALTALPGGNHEKEVLKLLKHRNMNIKKTAVAYLEVHGTIETIQALVWLLLHNDNSGLREAVVRVLQRLSGANLPFILLNELNNTSSALVREFLISTLTNLSNPEEIQSFAQNYPAYVLPEGFEPAQNKKEVRELKQWLNEWTQAQKNIEATLTNTHDLSKAIENAPPLLNPLPATREAIAQYLRNSTQKTTNLYTWYSLMYHHRVSPTTQEARLIYSNASGSIKHWAWSFLSLDKAQEVIEWDNLLTYKEPEDIALLMGYFVDKKGVFDVLVSLIKAGKDVSSIRKFLQTSGATVPYLPEVLMHLYTQQNIQPKATKTALANWIVSLPGSFSAAHRLHIFANETNEQKLHLLGRLNTAEQSILHSEILFLYQNISTKEKGILLDCLKNIWQHPKLIETSFAEYLAGKTLVFWQNQALSQALIIQLEQHPKAVQLISKRRDLEVFPDKLLLRLIKSSYFGEEPNLRHYFAGLSPERQWQVLGQNIAQGELFLLELIGNYTPLINELLRLLQSQSLETQVFILDWLDGFNMPLFLPAYSLVLLEFCQQWQHPLPAVRLLFKLDIGEVFIQQFVKIFADYKSNIKVEILSYALSHALSASFQTSAFSEKLSVHCYTIKEQALVLQIRIKLLDYTQFDEATQAIDLLKVLLNKEKATAVASLATFVENIAGLPIRQQLQLLQQLYVFNEFKVLITNAITRIFAHELLALSFLTPENRAIFEEGFCNGVKNKQFPETEEVRKVLKNFAEEPTPKVLELMEYVVFHDKHNALKTLCLRLLKNTLPRPVYLNICFSLLNSGNIDLLKTAIRALTFAHYTPAIPKFIQMLFHKNKTIATAAENGLLNNPAKAVGALAIEIPKQRPDKRATLNKLLNKLQ